MIHKKLAMQNPVLAGAVAGCRSAKNKQQLIWKNKFIWTQIFFPCGGMAVLKSLLYVNKN